MVIQFTSSFVEIILLATAKEHQYQGFGRSMVCLAAEIAKGVGTRRLVIDGIKSSEGFWSKPHLLGRDQTIAKGLAGGLDRTQVLGNMFTDFRAMQHEICVYHDYIQHSIDAMKGGKKNHQQAEYGVGGSKNEYDPSPLTASEDEDSEDGTDADEDCQELQEEDQQEGQEEDQQEERGKRKRQNPSASSPTFGTNLHRIKKKGKKQSGEDVEDLQEGEGRREARKRRRKEQRAEARRLRQYQKKLTATRQQPGCEVRDELAATHHVTSSCAAHPMRLLPHNAPRCLCGTWLRML
jgi:hypothetical protein